ncbi:MAG TPA: IS110 family transposase [Bacteroidetes bacterium]|nr:IS110 family transposase [Bacteroidota bacterium]
MVGIIAEIRPNMSNFPTHKHIASWAGVSPGSNESAGKNKNGRITYGNSYRYHRYVSQNFFEKLLQP